MKLYLQVLIVLLLFGCARGPTIRSTVSVFHELPTSVENIKYAVMSTDEQAGSLEYKQYAQQIKAELGKRGMVEVGTSDAEVLLFFAFGVDDGKEVVRTFPIYGQTGTSQSHTTGAIISYGNYGTFYSGTTTSTPTYGVVGSGVRSNTQFARFLFVDLLDNSAATKNEIKKVYEARVLSSGSSAQTAEVIPTLIAALFAEFPGKSGSTRKSKLHMVK